MEEKEVIYIAPRVQVIDIMLEGSILSGSETGGGSVPADMSGEDW
ncbi:hypothetical protein [Phocaeicola oris]|nr:hypothetical protein [Phocaeicola oris]